MRKLIFVYNAESGIFNSIADYGRRALSDNYPCSLSLITHGLLGMRSQWRRFVRKLDLPAEFLRKDAFVAQYPRALIKKYPKNISYPCVLVKSEDALDVLIASDELRACKTVDDLKDLITKKLLMK